MPPPFAALPPPSAQVSEERPRIVVVADASVTSPQPNTKWPDSLIDQGWLPSSTTGPSKAGTEWEETSSTTEPTRGDQGAEATLHPDFDLEDVVVDAKPVRRFSFRMKVRRISRPGVEARSLPGSETLIDSE